MEFSMKWVSLIALVVQTSSVVLTMRYSKISQGQPSYLNSTAVVMAELVKMATSFLLVLHGCEYDLTSYKKALQQGLLNVNEMKHVAIPAVLYVFQNNFLFLAISNLDAPTYQVSYQLKIFTTAILSSIVLGKRLTLLKWFGLFLLFTGVCLVQLPKDVLSGGSGAKFVSETNTAGLIYILLACFTSAFAGVYFEKLLKTSKTSVWMRNIQLGMYGLVFGTIGSVYYDHDHIAANGFFQGYTRIVWAVILLNSAGGLIVAAVIKYADNILKGFANAIAIISSSICSYYILNDANNIDLKFAVGASLVISATFIYTHQPDMTKLVKKTDTQIA